MRNVVVGLCLLLSACASESVLEPSATTREDVASQTTAAESVETLVEPVSTVAEAVPSWRVEGPQLTDVPWTDTYNREWLWAVTNAQGHRLEVLTFDAPEVNGGAVTTDMHKDAAVNWVGTTALVKVGVKAGSCGRREVHLTIDGVLVWVLLKFPTDCQPPTPVVVPPVCPTEDSILTEKRAEWANGILTTRFTVRPGIQGLLLHLVVYEITGGFWIGWTELPQRNVHRGRRYVDPNVPAYDTFLSGPGTLRTRYDPTTRVQADIYSCQIVTEDLTVANFGYYGPLAVAGFEP